MLILTRVAVRSGSRIVKMQSSPPSASRFESYAFLPHLTCHVIPHASYVCNRSAMANWRDKAKSFADNVADKATSTAREAGEYAKGAGEYLQGKAQEGWEKLDPDTQAAIEEVVEKTVEKKQEISGEKMHQEVLEMVQRQEEYNDLLASKLDDALSRIEELEARLDESDSYR